jgi:hypothetical protein
LKGGDRGTGPPPPPPQVEPAVLKDSDYSAYVEPGFI